MKVTSVEKKEKSTVELTIEVGAEEFEAAVQQAYLKNRGRISVPGFRKGKAPRKIIEGMYGAGVFYEDAINAVYPGAYEEAVKEQNLDDVGYPKMEVVEVGKDGFTFKALVSVRPEVKLGTYKGLTAPKEEAKVTEKDIDNELKPYIERATRLVSVKRKAKKGDTAVIDFEGFDNGTPFEGGKGENYDLKLGSGVAPIPAMKKAGVNVALGTDGMSSHNSADFFSDIKLAAVLHNGVGEDPSALSAWDALEMATVRGAAALGRTDTGVIAPGKIADLILVDFTAPNLTPCHDEAENLVFAAHGSNVAMNMCRGRVIYEKGEFLTLDLEQIRAQVKEYALPLVFGA